MMISSFIFFQFMHEPKRIKFLFPKEATKARKRVLICRERDLRHLDLVFFVFLISLVVFKSNPAPLITPKTTGLRVTPPAIVPAATRKVEARLLIQ